MSQNFSGLYMITPNKKIKNEYIISLNFDNTIQKVLLNGTLKHDTVVAEI